MKKLSLLLLLIVSLAANSTTYYISTSGNDASSGTSPSTPWKTIAKINSRTFLPGDFILFKRGNMWREQLTIPSSGSAGRPITFGAYGTGNKPIINGADIITGWINAGNNRWYVANPSLITTRAMVSIGGVLFSEVNSLAQVNSSAKYFVDVNANPDRLYVYSTVDPGQLTAEVSKRLFCIFASDAKLIHHVNIVNLECRFAVTAGVMLSAIQGGPAFNGSCIVDSCHFYACRLLACTAYDRHSNNIFRNSSADHCGNGFYAWIADDISIINCTTSNNINHTIRPGYTDGHGFGAYKADDWLVENCVSTNDADGIHPDCGGIAADYIIRYNKVYNPKAGNPCIGVGSMGAGGVGQIYYNLLVNGNTAAFESHTPSQGTVYLYNNTMVINASGGTEAAVVLTYGSNFVFKNNLIYRDKGDYKTLLTLRSSGLPTSDFNQFYQTTPSVAKHDFYYNGKYYNTLAAWKAGVNRDQNSKSGNPLFVNALTNWSLQAGSPCINAGVNVGLTRDIAGNPIVGRPDIGAYEFSTTSIPAADEPPAAKAIQVNIFGGSNPYNNSEWNNWNIGTVRASNITSTAFTYSDGTTSPITATLSHTRPLVDNGSTYSSGMVPAEVLRYTSSSTKLRTLTLKGLSTSKTYSIELYASRGSSIGESTIFTVNGSSQTINVVNNFTNKASFTSLTPNTSGQIVVGINKVGTYNYINGFTLTESSGDDMALGKVTDITEAEPLATVHQPVAGTISVYPNPVSNRVLLTINSGYSGSVQVYMADATGSVQKTFRFVKSSTIMQQWLPVDDLTKGVYFVTVQTGNQRQAVPIVKH